MKNQNFISTQFQISIHFLNIIKMKSLQSSALILVLSFFVLTFITGQTMAQKLPVAHSVMITGGCSVGDLLEGHYTYADEDDDQEQISILNWYRYNDVFGNGAILINTGPLYTLTNADNYIGFEVTPVSNDATLGPNVQGAAVKSRIRKGIGNDTVTAGLVETDATYQNISIRWNVTDDDNRNSSMSIQFKKTSESGWNNGAITTYSHPGIITRWDLNGNGSNENVPLNFHHHAGSAMFLEEGQTYDVKLVLTDPDNLTPQEQIVQVTTKTAMSEPTGGNRIDVYVAPASTGSSTPTYPTQPLPAFNAKLQ